MSQGQVTMNLFVGRKISLEALKAGYFRVPGWNGYPETSSHEDLDESGLKDRARSWDEEMVRFMGGT
jgi:hypothetical protein